MLLVKDGRKNLSLLGINIKGDLCSRRNFGSKIRQCLKFKIIENTLIIKKININKDGQIKEFRK